ncbi:phage major capsid protein [Paracandidimonas soli]|uniref:HK97 family phage major capsid protein n=1 Tax=Paracandidimonas soli TaxID=1917182 RepID=A0A4R3V1K7_9BURK|nr:phage major capsid protein [Paracandidimonas soli]TCU97311.1 HK97 family phage major capsid protein [Paracandidimonas soli]
MTPEQQIEQINANLKTVGDQLKTMAEKADADMKNRGTLDQQLRADIDKTLTTQGELLARLSTAEQLLAKVQNGGGAPGQPQSIGAKITESEDFKAFSANPKGDFKMSVQAAVTSDGASAGDLIVPDRIPGIQAPALRRLTIRDLISWGRTSSNAVEYARELVFTNNAAPVAEGAQKPESDITFEATQAPIVTIAHWIPASKQVIADIPMLQSYIDGRLRYGLKFKEEAQLLKGSGVGLNINGIYTQASAYANPGVLVQAETRIDRLRLALLQVELAEYWADGIVISPLDWAAIELTKTDNNAYLFANPRAQNLPGLWGRNVVPTQAMDMGDFLVGAFGGALAVEGWDREDVTVAISEHDRDNFVKNMLTIRCEERVGLTVYRPQAFVKGDFDGIDADPGTGG